MGLKQNSNPAGLGKRDRLKRVLKTESDRPWGCSVSGLILRFLVFV